MPSASAETIRLEPEVAKSVDLVLELIKKTVCGELRWVRRPLEARPLCMDYLVSLRWLTLLEMAISSVKEYEAVDTTGKWVISILGGTRPATSRVLLTQLNNRGEHLFTEVRAAALDGLAAVVQGAAGEV